MGDRVHNARTEARWVARQAKQADRRVLRRGAAREAVAGVAPGVEIEILTYGQFSLIDLWEALSDQMGPADVFACAWTIGRDEIERVVAAVERGGYRSLRILVDRAMSTANGASPARRRLGELLEQGKVQVRTSQVHAKFVLFDPAEGPSVIVRTSMNLNDNPRTEFASVSTDPELIAWWRAESEHIWSRAREGLDGQARIPSLATAIRMGREAR